MRGYGEVVDVLVDEAGRPCSFVWRGRRYRITALLQVWHEVVPWWREAALMELTGEDGDEGGCAVRERL